MNCNRVLWTIFEKTNDNRECQRRSKWEYATSCYRDSATTYTATWPNYSHNFVTKYLVSMLFDKLQSFIRCSYTNTWLNKIGISRSVEIIYWFFLVLVNNPQYVYLNKIGMSYIHLMCCENHTCTSILRSQKTGRILPPHTFYILLCLS